MTSSAPPSAKSAARLPRVRTASIVGMGPVLQRDPLIVVRRVAQECGDIGGFRIGPKLFVFLSSPELAYEVLIGHPEDFDKGQLQLRATTPLLGNGLLTSDGEHHARQRKVIAPHFLPRHIAHYVSTMVALARGAVERWQEGQEVELCAAMNQLSMEIVGQVLLSANFGEERRLAAAITAAFEWEMHALTSALVIPLSVPTPRNVRMRRALAYLRSQIGGIIAERRSSGEEQEDMLSLLLSLRYEDGASMSDEQLFDELITLCGAAQETSADAISWALYLLAKHRAVYARVRDEVDTVLAGRAPTYEDLRQLPYCLQVFKEALRLYPPGSIMLRGAVRDTTIGGYGVPAKTTVAISPWALHRRPDVFLDPDRFDPDRFEREQERKLPKCGFMPFGAGHRVCLGNHFSLMEGQALIAALAQCVELELVGHHPVEAQLLVNLRAKYGIRVRVRHRGTKPEQAFRESPPQSPKSASWGRLRSAG
jgi:cytochrome P450